MREIRKTFRVQDYDLDATLSSGQAFRWGARNGDWEGVVADRWVQLSQTQSGIAARVAWPVGSWTWLRRYLQLDTDLGAILRTFPNDPPMRAAVAACHGLRLLRQEPWECLASFILSSTKQIRQIEQMSNLLCERFGRAIPGSPDGRPARAFPTPERIADCSEVELRDCKLGFRAPNLLAAARAILEGGVAWKPFPSMSLGDARKELMKLPGVGPKIADCVLLFSGGYREAFPVDVWVRRALQRLYFPGKTPSMRTLEEFAKTHFGSNAGYAQQYLFHHARVHLKLK